MIDMYTDYTQELLYLKRSDLELDKDYDIRELGKRYGHIIIYVDSEEVTEEKAAEILLGIKNKFDKEDVPFYSVSFTLQKPRDPDGNRSGEPIRVLYFLAGDIYEEGMLQRVHEAHAATDAYYKELDNEKEMEKEIYIEKEETDKN